MYQLFDASFFRVKGTVQELAPMVAKHGMGGINVPVEILEDVNLARKAAKCVYDNGLQWGLLPTPVDCLSGFATDDKMFDEGMEKLKRWAEIGEKIGVKRSYNHVIPGSDTMSFDENYEWHVRRVSEIYHILNNHGIQYSLEFIGPVPLKKSFKYPFFDSIAGVLSIADAISSDIGFLFDTYHWYCGGGRMDDLYYASAHVDRMVCFHINDGIVGRTREQQEDLERAMPMTTGIVDSLTPYKLFQKCGYSGSVMVEPIYPLYNKFETMRAEDVVIEVAAAYKHMENLLRKE